MPERVYTNRIPGQERIHIELTPPEIEAVLADFLVGPHTSDTSMALLRILVDAKERFDGVTIGRPDDGRASVLRSGRAIVHGCPPNGSGVTTCCGLTPVELPRTDRLSMLAADVTCTGGAKGAAAQ